MREKRPADNKGVTQVLISHLQLQMRDPTVLLQVAKGLQPPLFVAHSSISRHISWVALKGFDSQPFGHLHNLEPFVLMQEARQSHPPLLLAYFRHSLMSLQMLSVMMDNS